MYYAFNKLNFFFAEHPDLGMGANGLTRLANYVFRADSGFFGDSFLSAVEQAGYDYLVKVKLKNLNKLLADH